MSRASFRNALLRCVSSQTHARRTELAKSVLVSVGQFEMEAETDDRLFSSEKECVRLALDAFEKSIMAMVFDPKSDVGSHKKGLQYLIYYFETCSHQRLLQSSEEIISKATKSGLLNAGAVEMKLIALIFKRLKELKGLHGMKSKVSSLGGQILREIESLISNEIDQGMWVELMQLACCVVQTCGNNSISAFELTRMALDKLEQTSTLGEIRLLASEFVSVSIASKKNSQHNHQLMMQSLLCFLEDVVTLLISSFEEENIPNNKNEIEQVHEYKLSTDHLMKESRQDLMKVLAGGIDLLERLLTMPLGIYFIPIPKILNLLLRVLSVNYSQIKGKLGSPQSFEFLSVLPEMQMMAWETLHLLLVLSGKSCLLHFNHITQTIVHSLQDISNQTISVASWVYKTTRQYLRTTGIAGVMHAYESVIQALKYEFRDVLREKEKTDRLKVSGENLGSRKKRKKSNQIEVMAAEVELLLFQNANQKTSVDSQRTQRVTSQIKLLDLLGELLEMGANILPLDLFQELENSFGSICCCCHQKDNDAFTLEVHRALLRFILSTSRYRSRLLSLGIRMFQDGLANGKSLDLKELCRNALQRLDILMHPRSTALTLPSIQPPKMPSPCQEHENSPLVASSPVEGAISLDGNASDRSEQKQGVQISKGDVMMIVNSDESLPDIDSGDSD